MTTFLENLEKSENLFKSGKSQEKQAKSGKSQGNHDCAILLAYITNSNNISKSTQNAHICIEVFKNFPGCHTPGPPLLRGWTPSQIPPLSPLCGTTLARRASAQSLQYRVCPLPTLLENSGKSQGISFDLESGHH